MDIEMIEEIEENPALLEDAPPSPPPLVRSNNTTPEEITRKTKRTPRKKKVEIAPEPQEQEEQPEDQPRRGRPPGAINIEKVTPIGSPSAGEIDQEMLRLWHTRHAERTNHRRNLYSSWF